MSKKIGIYEIPYAGIDIDNEEGFFFGFSELIRPDGDVVIYSGGKNNEKLLDEIEGYFAAEKGHQSLLGPAAGAVVLGSLFGSGVTGVCAAWGWRRAGRRRFYKRAAENSRNGKARFREVDFNELYSIGKNEGIEEKIGEYRKMAETKEKSYGGWNGKIQKALDAFENDEMLEYRQDFLFPAFKKLEESALKTWSVGGEGNWRRVYEAYKGLNERLIDGKKLRTSPF
ncbi:MAG: hypothetical protein HZB68_00950 [Candidatus Aenigmarchaeota archaeon]|nr:hypothetical protein [Candidatus Aenigmarchaeota archaeon]